MKCYHSLKPQKLLLYDLLTWLNQQKITCLQVFSIHVTSIFLQPFANRVREKFLVLISEVCISPFKTKCNFLLDQCFYMLMIPKIYFSDKYNCLTCLRVACLPRVFEAVGSIPGRVTPKTLKVNSLCFLAKYVVFKGITWPLVCSESE